MTDTSDRITVRRDEEYELHAQPDDVMRLHEYNGTWILFEDADGNPVLRIYDVTDQQFADLYAAIGRKLGVAASVTMEQLRGLKQHLDKVLG